MRKLTPRQMEVLRSDGMAGSPQEACDTGIEFFAGVLDLPPPDSARALRLMASAT